MTHFASGTNAMFDEDVETAMGTIGAQYMSYERYGKTAHQGAFGSTFIVAGFATKMSGLGGVANARPELFGPELHAFMKRAVKNLTRITAFGEEQPKIENRLELASEKDEFGMPLGRIIHSYDDNDAALWNANFEEGLEDRQGDRRQGGLAGPRQPADHPFDGGHHHGNQCRQLRGQQLRPDPRDPATSTSPAPAFSPPRARRTRPTRSSPCRCAARRTWRGIGARSRGRDGPVSWRGGGDPRNRMAPSASAQGRCL